MFLACIHEAGDADAVRGLANEWHRGAAAAACALEPLSAPVADTLEGQAARVADALQRLQPQGPYRVMGWAQAGLLAYQVATQLVGRDCIVEFIGVVGDAVRPGDHAPPPSPSLPVTVFTGVEGTSGRAGALAWESLLPASQLSSVAVDGAPGERVRALTGLLATAVTRAPDPATSQQELDYWAALPIQAGLPGHGTLFCIPGAGDSVTGFTALAGALGRSWSVQGLQPRGMDGQIPHVTVEAAASAYLRCIAALRPREPVHLLGHSFGGWVAYEIACRLEAAHQPPASLTLVDSEAPGQGGVVGGEHSAFDIFAQFVEILEMVAERSVGIDPKSLAAATDAERVRMVHAAMVRAGLISPRSRPESLKGALRTFAAALRTEYLPSHGYNGPMRLVVVANRPGGRPDREQREHTKVLGWQSIAPQMTCWKGPGNHMTILKSPHATELVRWWLEGLPTNDRPEEASRPSSLAASVGPST